MGGPWVSGISSGGFHYVEDIVIVPRSLARLMGRESTEERFYYLSGARMGVPDSQQRPVNRLLGIYNYGPAYNRVACSAALVLHMYDGCCRCYR